MKRKRLEEIVENLADRINHIGDEFEERVGYLEGHATALGDDIDRLHHQVDMWKEIPLKDRVEALEMLVKAVIEAILEKSIPPLTSKVPGIEFEDIEFEPVSIEEMLENLTAKDPDPRQPPPYTEEKKAKKSQPFPSRDLTAAETVSEIFKILNTVFDEVFGKEKK